MTNSALELNQRMKAEQAFYEAAQEGKTLEEAREAAVVAAQKVYQDYVLGSVGVES